MADPLRADALKSSMTAWRRAFHTAPELGFGEHQTAKRIANLLRSFGLDMHKGIGGTGVVGILRRGNGLRSIGLRAAAMLRDRLLQRFDVDEVYGMHNIPGMPVGSFATRRGADHRQ